MLAIRDLVKVYPGGVPALQGINLDIGEGMFGLLGPNGAGKSTLMRILAGLLEPTAGTVQLDGDEYASRPERIWGKLGYLPQEFGFYPHLTGEQMLAYLLRLKGIAPPGGLTAYGRELLERVNLTFARTRKVKTYSGGMRQRLGIAQALAGDPRLIVVDEPTAGLDPEERYRFYGLLAELAQNRIVLLSTHIVEDVSVLCSRLAVIRNGKLVAQTTPGEACAALDGAVFEGTVEPTALPEFRRRHRVTHAFLVEGRHRVRLHARNGDDVPTAFVPVKPTLEDAYMLTMQAEPNGPES